jgi:purine-nucleoside phosphorylase
MNEVVAQTEDAVHFLRTKTQSKPTVGIILGTGLGGLVKEIEEKIVIDYKEIPHFPLSTVESHHGKLIFGRLAGKQIVAMQGRFHFYEGYTMKQITFPVRVMKRLGVETLLISNAGGVLNPEFKKGEVMIITDHINLLGDNPLIGRNDESLGVRFPDMSEPYTKELIELAVTVARDLKIPVRRGVYAAMTGPNLETRAEYRFLRSVGADMVGMSTIPEVIVAVHSKMNTLGFSIGTDECFPDALQPVTVEEVIAVAKKAEPNMTAIMKEVIGRLSA